MPSSPWHRILDSPNDSHLVQFYGWDPERLARNVSQYLKEGLKNGEGGIVISTSANAGAFRERLDAGGRDRVVWLDAEETLARLVLGQMPDWDLFEAVLAPVLRRGRREFKGIRAYGEMVGILWTAGNHVGAVRLEQFWNRLLSRSSFQLFCGYPIDIFSRDFDPAGLDALLSNHTHIVPAAGEQVESAICRAMEEILGSKAAHAEAVMKSEMFRARWGILPRSEGLILWMRRNVPARVDEILSRARTYCVAQPA